MSPRLRRVFSLLGPVLFALWSIWTVVRILQRDDAPATQIFLGVTGAVILVGMVLILIYKAWREPQKPSVDSETTSR